MQNINDINIQPCIRSGYCCNKAPCYFGEVTSNTNPSCKFLEGNSPGNYKCGKYDEIVAGMPENNAELIGWDGILEGRKAENGNYLMVVKGVTIYQENINRQGVFTLLR